MRTEEEIRDLLDNLIDLSNEKKLTTGRGGSGNAGVGARRRRRSSVGGMTDGRRDPDYVERQEGAPHVEGASGRSATTTLWETRRLARCDEYSLPLCRGAPVTPPA